MIPFALLTNPRPPGRCSSFLDHSHPFHSFHFYTLFLCISVCAENSFSSPRSATVRPDPMDQKRRGSKFFNTLVASSSESVSISGAPTVTPAAVVWDLEVEREKEIESQRLKEKEKEMEKEKEKEKEKQRVKEKEMEKEKEKERLRLKEKEKEKEMEKQRVKEKEMEKEKEKEGQRLKEKEKEMEKQRVKEKEMEEEKGKEGQRLKGKEMEKEKEKEREREIEMEKEKEKEKEKEREKVKSRSWGKAPVSSAASIFAPEITPPTPAPALALAPQKLLPARKNPFLKSSISTSEEPSLEEEKAPGIKTEKVLSRVQQMIKDKEEASKRRPSVNLPLPSPLSRKGMQMPVESLDDYDEDVVEF